MKTVDDLPSDKGKPRDSTVPELEAISIIQRGNLKSLEATLRKQWRLGQNIVLCWCEDQRGLLVLLVPHYFMGNYCAGEEGDDNERFFRELLSGERRKDRTEIFAIADRLRVAPTFIKLKTPLADDKNVHLAVEQIIKRYGLSYVSNRAVLLFDIADFSLYTPFEQASQLNSLSYSLNSAYNKLLSKGIEINFARTTTGDGYYVWNRNLQPFANQDLFYFMLLVLADNAVARSASKGNTVPVIRTAYHIGSHYELYQAEGVNPTVFSYIVGDVTIELARMIALAQPHQILVGDFECDLPTMHRGKFSTMVSSPEFVRNCNRELVTVTGIQLSGQPIKSLSCFLTDTEVASGERVPRRFRITDKHGLSRHAYNLQIEFDIAGNSLHLGLDERQLPTRGKSSQPQDSQPPAEAEKVDKDAMAEELFEDLASMLKKRSGQIYTDD